MRQVQTICDVCGKPNDSSSIECCGMRFHSGYCYDTHATNECEAAK